MSKIPCKKCRSCGLYSDLSVTSCRCGADLGKIPAFLIETSDISPEEYGDIRENAAFYVQKCSACGALNFTADKDSPVRVCYNCHKTRVASIVPSEYIDESAEEGESGDRATDARSEGAASAEALPYDDDDDDDDDDDSAAWQGILGNIKRSLGSDGTETDDSSASSGALGNDGNPNQSTVQRRDITLSAICYGTLSFTVAADPDTPYMLGRSANQSEFLMCDRRVGNEHCCLTFKSGAWYVRDNHSANGTFVNSRDIGLDGECVLHDGDELKLGHNADSVAFRVTIK